MPGNRRQQTAKAGVLATRLVCCSGRRRGLGGCLYWRSEKVGLGESNRRVGEFGEAGREEAVVMSRREADLAEFERLTADLDGELQYT